MKQQRKQIHKCSKRQKRTAGTAISCLVLLLLYGCAYQGQQAAVTVLSEDKDAEENSVVQSGRDVMQETEEGVRFAETDDRSASSRAEEKLLTVYVCGAVVHPGVYELPAQSRVYEAVALAGGMSEEAALTAVNQAELLADEQMIVIPTVEEQQAETAGTGMDEQGIVNINTADLEELKTLPGIGDSKARSIISYREKNGAFGAVQDIKNVDGIGDGVFAKLEGCIKVD